MRRVERIQYSIFLNALGLSFRKEGRVLENTGGVDTRFLRVVWNKAPCAIRLPGKRNRHTRFPFDCSTVHTSTQLLLGVLHHAGGRGPDSECQYVLPLCFLMSLAASLDRCYRRGSGVSP